jgi:RNA polymerase sigma factor (sigma-70 family)
MNFDPSEIRTLIRAETRRTGAPVHDEDLEQDVALHALEAFHRLNRVTHPRALLMKIVRDAVHDHWRRRRSSEDLDGIDERFVSHRPAFESDLDRERRVELLHHALARLSSAKRSLLDLFYVHDYSISQIAKLKKKSISAVKMDLLRSRQSLARIVRSLATKKSR